jgi:hypothetical protein
MPYKLYIDHTLYLTEKSKDDVIQALMGYINGDGVVPMKLVYPDGSYYEFIGEGDE